MSDIAKQNTLAFARIGAQHRLNQLATEQSQILKLFPGLKPSASTAITFASSASPAPRARRKMSAAARKAVSARMKKYWAGRRASKK